MPKDDTMADNHDRALTKIVRTMYSVLGTLRSDRKPSARCFQIALVHLDAVPSKHCVVSSPRGLVPYVII